MANPDVIEFEEEPRQFNLGGIVGGILGALIGFKFARQTYKTPEPQPLPDTFIVNGEGDQMAGSIELWLTTGAFAAVGYWLGSMLTRATPKRFKLRHKD